MKLYLCDNPQYKTTKILKKAWEQDPNIELITDPYFNPLKANWADVMWVEWCEGSMQQASKREGGVKGMYNDFVDPAHKNPIDWFGEWKNTKLINRMIDIDVWYGHYGGVQWENVNALTYIAKHIFNVADRNMHFADRFPNLKIEHIPLSVEIDNLTFKDRTNNHGKNIAFVHHLWSGKGIPLALQVLEKVVRQDKEWKMYIVGNWSSEQWLSPFIQYSIKEMGLENNVVIQGRVPDVNLFLDNMDFVFSSSFKEAFSLIIGEGMAKGLKPIIFNWEGSKDIWDTKWIWNTVDEGAALLQGDYNSNEYREFVKRYDAKFEIEKANNLINSL